MRRRRHAVTIIQSDQKIVFSTLPRSILHNTKRLFTQGKFHPRDMKVRPTSSLNLISSSTVILSSLFVEPRAAILHVFVLSHVDLPPRQCSLLSDTSARCIVVREIFKHCRYWIVFNVEVLLNHSNVDIWSMSRRVRSDLKLIMLFTQKPA